MSITNPTPSPAPRITLGARVAADLHVLADIADTNPHLATHLAATVEQLHIVLAGNSDLNPEDFGDALTAHHAEPVPSMLIEPLWSTQAWNLPAGAIRLHVTQLAVPIEEIASDVADLFTPAGEL